ncbi:MAG: D-alanyl-D-alanine carboxypeptidase [Eubacteriaceae bacterium]|nr:D-alanyl-D-alanine carboxypeptidase [Eubacteriaceae bacterium]
MSFNRKLLLTALAILLALSFWQGEARASGYDLSGYQSAGIYVVEQNTDTVLLENRADERFYPGSITKILTAMTALDITDDLDEKVTVTSEMLSLVKPNSSRIHLSAGEIITYGDLMRGSLIRSGNDAAIAIGVFCGCRLTGSPDTLAGYNAFIEEMNEKSASLGLTGSHWANTDGYDDTENYSTPRDIVALGIAAQDYPFITETVKMLSCTAVTSTGVREFMSTNILKYTKLPDMMGGGPNLNYRASVTGMKTGNTVMGQKCLLVSAENGNMRITAAILNIPDKTNEIWPLAAGIIDYCLDGHRVIDLINEANRYISYEISNPSILQKGSLDVVTDESIRLCLDNDTAESLTCVTTMDPQKVLSVRNGALKLACDIQKGDVIGKMSFLCGGEIIAETELKALADYDVFSDRDIMTAGIIICTAIVPIALAVSVKSVKKKRIRARKGKNAAKST